MSRQLVHRGRKIQVYVETNRAADGSEITRDIIIHPGAVAVLPLLDGGRVCLLRNQRANVGGELVEIPAGTLEPGEAPEAAALRELAEETGYRAGKLHKLCAFYPSPGCISELTHVYAATDLTPGPTQLEADEELESLVVPWAQLVGWVKDGTIRDGKTIIAVLWWEGRKA
jgi:ADP-ribose pyrophosphatase